jgi:hypothetical protein
MARRGYTRGRTSYQNRPVNHGQFFSKLSEESRVDTRKQLGEKLEPFARFDSDIERFCCRKCGYQAETYRGINAHVAECYL